MRREGAGDRGNKTLYVHEIVSHAHITASTPWRIIQTSNRNDILCFKVLNRCTKDMMQRTCTWSHKEKERDGISKGQTRKVWGYGVWDEMKIEERFGSYKHDISCLLQKEWREKNQSKEKNMMVSGTKSQLMVLRFRCRCMRRSSDDIQVNDVWSVALTTRFSV